jgi:hypothetical protein
MLVKREWHLLTWLIPYVDDFVIVWADDGPDVGRNWKREELLTVLCMAV